MSDDVAPSAYSVVGMPPQRPAFYECKPPILEKRGDLLRNGYQFVSNAKPKPNEECGCGSKRKFKNCCTSNIVRAAGATWFKPGARRSTRRMK